MPARTPRPSLDRQVVAWLRLEGLAALVAGAALYLLLGGDWIWFVLLLLVPDVSMVGYLRGPRIGALTYNLGHSWAVGLGVLGLGAALALTPVALVGAILLAHSGMDRGLGYGLKLTAGFKDTHLGRIGGRPDDVDASDTVTVVAPSA